jgi:tetratricopeptide (TPR) repeat protein
MVPGAGKRIVACLLAALLGAASAAAQPAGTSDGGMLKAQEAASALVKGQLQQAVQLYTEALADTTLSNDRRASLHNDRGVALSRLRQMKAAIDDFNRAVQLYPEYSVVYNNRGNVLLGLGLTQEAIKDFDRAILLAPVYAAAFNNRAGAFMRLGDTDAAIRDYGRAIALAPTNAVALNGRGRAHMLLQRPYTAMRDFTRALSLDVRYAAAYRSRAEARLVIERPMQAAEDLSRAIAFDAQNAELYVLRGMAYLAARNPASALKDFTQALELDPDSTAALVQRGYGHAVAEAFEDALSDLARALEKDPSNVLALAYRAWTYKQTAQADLGMKDVERGLKLAPERPELLWARGELHEALGRREEAVADLRRALELKPGMWEAHAGLERMGLRASADEHEVPALTMEPWRVVTQGRQFFAIHPDFGRMRVPLEMLGSGQPKLLAWDVQPSPFHGYAILRFTAGATPASGKLEDVEVGAVVDLAQRSVVAIEPLKIGEQRTTLTWEPGRLVVASLEGFTHDFALTAEHAIAAAPVPAAPTGKRAADRSAYRPPGGTPFWAPWATPPGYPAERGPSRPSGPPRKPKTLFDLLFN